MAMTYGKRRIFACRILRMICPILRKRGFSDDRVAGVL
jgi:hypothetical protein